MTGHQTRATHNGCGRRHAQRKGDFEPLHPSLESALNQWYKEVVGDDDYGDNGDEDDNKDANNEDVDDDNDVYDDDYDCDNNDSYGDDDDDDDE